MAYNYDCDDFGSAKPGSVDVRPMRINRYVKVATWARDRYSYDGNLITHVGGVPSKYTRIERAAWAKYCA